MVLRDTCPACGSSKYTRNGHSHHGTQNYQGKNGGRQFVQGLEPYRSAEETRARIERLLVERIALRGSCRVVGGTLTGVWGVLVPCIEALPDHLHVQPVACDGNVIMRRLDVEADEMASVVQKHANKRWLGIAMDAATRHVLAVHVGDRSRESAQQLWATMPLAYRQHATFYTDHYVVYAGVIPAAQHRAIHK